MDHTTGTVSVTQPLTLEFIDRTGAATPLDAELRYSPADPYAVTALFSTDAGPVPWTFGRDLLATSLHEPCGDGDVHLWPCLDERGHAVVVIELSTPSGEALVQASSADVSRFVQRILAMVPAGEEFRHVDVDAAIHAILGSETA